MRTALMLLLSLGVVLAACFDFRESLVSPGQQGGFEGSDAALGARVAALHATVRFGEPRGTVGTEFFPGSHDQSLHAYDNVRPQAVVIAAGGSVTFEIPVSGLHQVAIYEPGTRPEDIDITQTEPVPAAPVVSRITDGDALVVRGPDQQFAALQWTTPAGTFDEPGTYLVICTTVPHFVIANMYGWVIVQ